MNPSLKASDIYNGARALLNDIANTNFTNVAMQPFLDIALTELSEMFEDNGLPATTLTSMELPVRAGMLDIGGNTGPALPIDLVEITSLWERYLGSNVGFIRMSKRDYLPETPTQTTYLIYWSWQNQIINFIGATADVGVKIEYVGNVFPKIQSDDTIIPIINAKNPLTFRTAALAAEFIGENKDRADSLNGQGGAAVDRLINLSLRGEQAVVTRRKPFRANWKTRQTGF
jgi:hypothetical protein